VNNKQKIYPFVESVKTLAIKKNIIFSLILLFLNGLSLNLFAQKSGETVVPLNNNQDIYKFKKSTRLFKSNSIELPFFDDFSYIDKFGIDSNITKQNPFDTLWENSTIFLNATMGVNPPSVGVATFDGLDKNGVPYNLGGVNVSSPADTLLSRPINLSSHGFNDSTVYLSFFYQPTGYGDDPEFEDSIVLEGKDISGNWKLLWHKSATTLAPFKLVMVPIKGSDSFFYNGFQFRFTNMASPTGNLDHWHIDYVYMASGRSKNDTAFKDQAFVYLPKSVLKDYQSIPARHYYRNTNQKDLFKANNTARVFNNYNKKVFPNFRYDVTSVKEKKIFAKTSSLGSTTQQINPKDTLSFSLRLRDSANVNVFINSDTIELLTRNTLIPQLQNDSIVGNNVSYRRQKFTSFYAYDDGTAEKGYGLINSIGKVALKFNTKVDDSLQGVLIRFNYSLDDVSKKIFKLMVWKNISPVNTIANPAKEVILYQSDNMTPIYSTGYGNLVYIPLPNRIKTGLGDFYIGWYQTDKYLLNVGLDANYGDEFTGGKPNENLFYNSEGTWRQTAYPYAPIIRPVFGVPTFVSVPKIENEKAEIILYPNPAQDYLKINCNKRISKIELIDVLGRNYSVNFKENILGTSELNSGFYLVKLFIDGEQNPQIKRFLKQ